MGLPILAHHFERSARERDYAVLGPLSSMHVNKISAGVNIGDLEKQTFVERQPTRINRGQVNLIM
ncbi:MAG: hypothetical protein O3B01_07880 [Planctomycetota bacterium]|nr:hypothetical protein [Planctomycetota bacterium]MDA1138489.1 hypothetical protein [Planctomycetota bacterium]